MHTAPVDGFFDGGPPWGMPTLLVSIVMIECVLNKYVSSTGLFMPNCYAPGFIGLFYTVKYVINAGTDKAWAGHKEWVKLGSTIAICVVAWVRFTAPGAFFSQLKIF